ncbi:low-density lipoprotein receptor-like [Lytechinus variegatus]|uniref:low-density lipoprotein receptor-like n=1 Tax=Lytechinus variegatus TaxID=7654 RepID=UPI001BB1A59E|nr:low-density lipoprotein receptor-like [Lytechinus variegatus]
MFRNPEGALQRGVPVKIVTLFGRPHSPTGSAFCRPPGRPATTDPRPGAVCRDDEFACWNRECLPLNKLCDNSDDCLASEDELYCETGKCESYRNYVLCSNGMCVAQLFVCDGFPHCNDRADEQNCCEYK